MPDVVIIGGGIVGAACAYYATEAGLSVTLLERTSIGAGTTSRGEGNILISDKGPGPELELAIHSRRLWAKLGERLGPDVLELEEKGGLVVATSERSFRALRGFAASQAESGVQTVVLATDDLREHEPHLAEDLAGGVLYPDDMQLQPMIAASALLARARTRGAEVHCGVNVTGIRRDPSGKVSAVIAGDSSFATSAVINAAGTWSGELATVLGSAIPVLPRRGFVLVTEPLPRMVNHKVYSADYVANVSSTDTGLETSAVIEGTRGGTILIGASRERVGFDTDMPVAVLQRLATQAMRLFPFLGEVALLRVYGGFRPYCPDHLPVIGPDHNIQGLYHACGHEGAGIGLAPVTGLLLAQLLSGQRPIVDVSPFSSQRFEDTVIS